MPVNVTRIFFLSRLRHCCSGENFAPRAEQIRYRSHRTLDICSRDYRQLPCGYAGANTLYYDGGAHGLPFANAKHFGGDAAGEIGAAFQDHVDKISRFESHEGFTLVVQLLICLYLLVLPDIDALLLAYAH